MIEPTDVLQKPVTQVPIPSNNRKNSVLVVVLIVLILITAGVVWAFRSVLFTKKTTIQTQQKVTPTVTTISEVNVAVEENYQSERLQYSINYPNGWFNIPNVDETDNYKFFSNEDVTSTEDISKDGVFISIEKVTQGMDFYQRVFDSEVGLLSSDENGVITKLSDLTIDNQNAVKFSYETVPRTSDKYFYAIDYVFKKDDSFYLMIIFTRDKNVADRNMGIFDKIANSFKFLQ